MAPSGARRPVHMVNASAPWWSNINPPSIVARRARRAAARNGVRRPYARSTNRQVGALRRGSSGRRSPDSAAAVALTTTAISASRCSVASASGTARIGAPPFVRSSARRAARSSPRFAMISRGQPASMSAVATARAGNVIGGGDWAQDRLLPDAVRAWGAGETLHIRRPQATRPWQHVLEPLAAYLRLAQRLWEQPGLAGAYNFGPLPHEAATVKHVIELASSAYPQSATSYQNESEGPHEAGWLALETAHARQVLGVTPHWALNTAVARTMNWYRQQRGGADARVLCLADIDAWEARP